MPGRLRSGAAAPVASSITASLSLRRAVAASGRPLATLDGARGSNAGERVRLQHVLHLGQVGGLVHLERLGDDLGDCRPREVTGEKGGDGDLVGGVQPGRGAAAGASGLVGELEGRGTSRGPEARSRDRPRAAKSSEP